MAKAESSPKFEDVEMAMVSYPVRIIAILTATYLPVVSVEMHRRL